jgi:hypothetical protein
MSLKSGFIFPKKRRCKEPSESFGDEGRMRGKDHEKLDQKAPAGGILDRGGFFKPDVSDVLDAAEQYRGSGGRNADG